MITLFRLVTQIGQQVLAVGKRKWTNDFSFGMNRWHYTAENRIITSGTKTVGGLHKIASEN